MKRSSHEGSVVVYQYGTPHWADLDDEGMKQLRLAHDLWNELVAIERKADETVKATEAQAITALAEADAVIEAAAERVSELGKRLKQERMHDRTTKPRASTKAELQMARATLRVAKERRKATREEAKEARQAIRSEVNATKKTETGKAMYHTWTEKGLGWGTYNDVHDRVDTASKVIIKRRTQGEKAEFRFRYPSQSREGTLHVQCQEMAGKPRRVEWEITGDHRKHKTLRLRIGRARGLGSHWLELPFVYHRPLPCVPQDVTDVRVTRRVIGGKSRITIQFSCRVPAVKMRTNGTAISIRPRWKKLGQDMLVAELLSFTPLPLVPRDLEPVVKLTTPCSASVILPHTYLYPLSRADQILKVTRADLLEGVRPVVVAAMVDETIREIAKGEPAKWKSPARFAALAHRVPKTHPLYESLEMWRQRDKHLWTYESNERDQAIARRRDTYRKLAAWLATEAQIFAITGTDYAELKQRPTEFEDPHEQRHGRKQLQQIAPGELRLFIEQAAHKNGIQIMKQEKGDTQNDHGDADDSVGSTRGEDREPVAETGD